MVHREASKRVDTALIFPEPARPAVAPVLPPGLYLNLENSESLVTAQTQGYAIVGPGYALDPPLALPEASPKMATWAKVAAIPEVKGKGKAPTLDLHAPCSSSNTPSSVQGHKNPSTNEPAPKQQRIVFIKGCKEGTSLYDITKQISHGPLMSITIERGSKQLGVEVCIIFFNAEDAAAFLWDDSKSVLQKGHGLYGRGVAVTQGPPWPEDEEIRAMGTPGRRRERRRLTLNGGGLFYRISGTSFHADIAAIAGNDNIELIWLYNTGNATVVLASTRVAKAVMTELMRKARHGGVYEGVNISFASDPCEKPLNLVSAIPGIAAVKMG